MKIDIEYLYLVVIMICGVHCMVALNKSLDEQAGIIQEKRKRQYEFMEYDPILEFWDMEFDAISYI